jgi:NADPH:quinone reductase-like Zn-dependent oxidoreductase
LAGARVLGTSSSEEKLQKAKELGLDAGFNYKRDPAWSSWVKQHTNGEGADVIVEVGGSATLGESMKAVRVGGTIAQIGVLSGIEERLSITPILMRQIRILGIYVGSRTMMEAMNRAIDCSKLRPVVGKIFPFLATAEAYRYLEQGRHFGKIVISLDFGS